ncbi:hypothetical protein AGMMS50225_24080 [Betaproteobacteria bacterium]|nr:hypothetical protein AGMMS50225_24080 [Betaproteobacteria bacterium]
MTPITIRYQLTLKIWAAANAVATKKLNQRHGRSAPLQALNILAGLAYVMPIILALIFELNPLWFILPVLVLIIAGQLIARLANRSVWKETLQQSGTHSLNLGDAGLSCHTGVGDVLYPWQWVWEVSEEDGWLAIVVGAARFYVLPVANSAFPDPAARQAFLAALKEGMDSAQEERERRQSETSPAASETAETPAVSSAVCASVASACAASLPPERSTLLTDLRQLGRILLFRAPQPGTLTPDVSKLLLPVLLYFLLTLGIQIGTRGFPGELVWYSMTEVFSPFALVALLAGLAALVGGNRQESGRLWMAFSLMLLLLPLVNWYASRGGIRLEALGVHKPARIVTLLVCYLPYLWLALAGARLAERLTGRRNRSLATDLTVFVAFTLVFWLHSDPPYLWEETPDEKTNTARLNVQIDEDVLYGQPRLLEQQLAAIQPGLPGVAEIFFLGVGGYGYQDVFLREVRSVEQLFLERFHTQGHSLILVNNPATIQELPTANYESLQRALQRIGQQMNGAEDLLFLFLTSHGSREPLFSISLWPFRFTDLSPQMLRQALDNAGIQRRVIVVSSCYSGGFIPALQDKNTLIISASAADRKSFGCSNDNEFTDFGRAYFDVALRQTRSFTQAFEITAARIAEQERTEAREPSLPQMKGGTDLREQLKIFESDTPSIQTGSETGR